MTVIPEGEFIISFSYLIDDLFQQLFPNPLRPQYYEPKLSDSEVIIIEIVGEWPGHDRDRVIWQYFRRLRLHFLPNIPTRTQLASQAANLWAVKQKITERPGWMLIGMMSF